MKKVQTELLERKVIDDRTVASTIKYGKVTVYIKSIFKGTKNIDDVLFNMAKERMTNGKNQ